MVPVWFVLQWFAKMLAEHWAYSWSGAEYGKVSCAGAWVFIYKMWGVSLYHGSNTIWRKHTGRKGTLTEMAKLLAPGWAVFKWRKDGEPEQYMNDGEDDLYHIGCFIGPTAKYPEGAVIEAKGEKYGVVMTSINSGWSHAAEMAKVDYAATEEETGSTGIVTAQSGGTVNMRASASSTATIIHRVPLGSKVDILHVIDGWAKIRYGGKTGYMLERFIDIEYGASVPEKNTEDVYTVEITGYKGCGLSFEQAVNLMEDNTNAGYDASVRKQTVEVTA